MAIKLGFASLSFGASVDSQTGQLSVFEIVEELRAPQVPFHVQSLVLTLMVEKTRPAAAQGKIHIHIITPDQKSAAVGQGDLQMPADQKRLKAVFRLGGFPIQAFGAHRFVVSWTNATGAKEGEALLDFDVLQIGPNPNPAQLN